MALAPSVQSLLDDIAAGGDVRLEDMSAAEAREAFAGMALLDGEPVEMASVHDRSVPSSQGDVRVRVYRPREDGDLPVIVYFHGGGWVIGGLDTHDNTCRRLALAAECVVVSVDYRLAPENPYPAAPEDCYAALSWVSGNAATIGASADRIGLAADSAGGNLAAVVSMMARDRGGPSVSAQLLIYPVTDSSCATGSMAENAEGYFLTRAAMEWFWANYVGDRTRARSPYQSPLAADSLEGLPPALVITAEFDPLRDEGEAYARRLQEAGVAVQMRRYDGMIHGFISMAGALPEGVEAVRDAGAALGAILKAS